MIEVGKVYYGPHNMSRRVEAIDGDSITFTGRLGLPQTVPTAEFEAWAEQGVAEPDDGERRREEMLAYSGEA